MKCLYFFIWHRGYLAKSRAGLTFFVTFLCQKIKSVMDRVTVGIDSTISDWLLRLYCIKNKL